MEANFEGHKVFSFLFLHIKNLYHLRMRDSIYLSTSGFRYWIKSLIK